MEIINSLSEKQFLSNGTYREHAKYIKKNLPIDSNHEHFSVIFLNNKNRIIGHEVLFKGGDLSTIVDLKILLRSAITKPNVVGILVAHNHPSDDDDVSDFDLKMTHAINQACNICGLVLVDSLIYTRNKVRSIAHEIK